MNAAWKTHLETRFSLLGTDQQIAGRALLADFSPEGDEQRTKGSEAMLRLGKAERTAIWNEVFPGLADAVELLWLHLPPEYQEGEERFKWLIDESSHAEVKTKKLRDLLLLTSEGPHLSLAGILENYATMGNPKLVRLGHFALESLALVVIRFGGALADKIEKQIQDQYAAMDQVSSGLTVERSVVEALDFADRGYQWIDELPLAGIDESRRRALLPWTPVMPLPAWGKLLRVVVEHRLWRYPSIERWVPFALGGRWRWNSGPGMAVWLERCALIHNDPAERTKALSSRNPAELFFALCAIGRENGPEALKIAAEVLHVGKPEEQLAVIEFFWWCPWEIRTPHLVPLVSHGDARVAGAAIALLFELMDGAAALKLELLDRLEVRLQGLWPDKTPATPAPLPEALLDRQQTLDLIANAAWNGLEERTLPWLSSISSRERESLVYGLRRQWSDPAKRRLNLKFLRDPSWEVGEAALRSYEGKAMLPEERQAIEDLLGLKHPARRKACVGIMLQWPDPVRSGSLRSLLNDRKELKRQGGIELLRRLETQLAAEEHSKLVQELQAEGLVPAESEAAPVSATPTGGPAPLPPPLASIPNASTAFGLVDPAALPDYTDYRDLGTVLVTANTITDLVQLDGLIQEQLNTSFEITNWRGETEVHSIAGTRIPSAPRVGEMLDSGGKFPLYPIWRKWWEDRPDTERDGDGFDLVRMRIALQATTDSTKAEARAIILGIDELPELKSKPSQLLEILAWLWHEFAQDDWWEFCMDACESAFVRTRHLVEPTAYGPRFPVQYSNIVQPLLKYPDTEDHRRRLWKAGNGVVGRSFLSGANSHDTVWAFSKGLATKAEVFWHLCHGCFMGYLEGSFVRSNHPEIQPLIDEYRSAVLRAELMRGEAAQDSSKKADKLRGIEDLVAVLSALRDRPLRKSGNDFDWSREVVLTRLLYNSSPKEQETAEDFCRVMQSHSIGRNRIVELGVVSPAWAEWIGNYLNCPGYESMVWWLHIHCRTAEADLPGKDAVTEWKANAAAWSAVPGDDLLDGAVDAALFRKAKAGVDDAVWELAYQAARLICKANGHTRARLFADALLARVTTKDLIARIETKRDQEAVRALGLVPLPASTAAAKNEILKRYQVLATFLHTAKGAKAQRRASEETAGRIGLRNLAEAAGATDPEQFRWMMELEAGAVAASDFTGVTIGQITIRMEILPTGKVILVAEKAGQRLKAIPPPMRKDAAVVSLMERRDGLQEVAARIRPALESMMIHQHSLPAMIWRKLSGHPLVGPLLSRLVLGTSRGPLGWALTDGSGLRDQVGTLRAWPADDDAIHLCHTVEFFPVERWALWQNSVFTQGLIQPVKQVFRELFVLTEAEQGIRSIDRYGGLVANAAQAAAILGKSGWVNNSESGLRRHFHKAGIIATLSFVEAFDHPGQLHDLTIRAVSFTRSRHDTKYLRLTEVPAIVLSEALRDIERAWAIAHRPGSNPLHARSTAAMRGDLVRHMADAHALSGIAVNQTHAILARPAGEYRVDLHSAQVTLNGTPVNVTGIPSREEIFLPFVDEDPLSAEVISISLWLATH